MFPDELSDDFVSSFYLDNMSLGHIKTGNKITNVMKGSRGEKKNSGSIMRPTNSQNVELLVFGNVKSNPIYCT